MAWGVSGRGDRVLFTRSGARCYCGRCHYVSGVFEDVGRVLEGRMCEELAGDSLKGEANGTTFMLNGQVSV